MSRERAGRAIGLALVLAAAITHAQSADGTTPTPNAIATPGAATGELSGIVLERGTARPLGGVTVTMTDVARVARTDDDGRFRFIGAPVGRHTLTLAGPELDDVAVDEEVAGGRHREVRYLVTTRAPSDRYQSVVRAPRIERAGVVETGVGREEARHVAGAADDPLKVVEDLPGVARATVGSGALIIWGAAPADSRVVVDGVEIPALYHVGGWRSTIHGDLVSRVSLSPGGFGAEWGRALGGLVRVETTAEPERGVHGSVALDLLDASALLSATLGARVTLTVAGRYSWLDRLATAVVHGDAAAFVPLPRWDDYQLRATVRLRAREQLTLTLLAADDSLRRATAAADPAQAHRESFDRSTWRAIVRYSADRDGSAVELTPWFGYDDTRTDQRFGPTPARLAVTSVLAGLRATYRRRLARALILSVGLDLLDTHAHISRLGSLTIPAREGDPFVFGQPPGDDVAAADDRLHLLDAAPFASLDVRLGPVTITPGLRVDALLVEGDHRLPAPASAPATGFSRLGWSIDPRLAIRAQAHRRLLLTAAAGLYHQPPDPADLGARFGNPTLGPARALVVTAGGEVRLTAPLTAEANVYYRQLDDLVARNALPSPPVAAALVQDGSGRSYGAQLLVRLQAWHGLSGWLSYTTGRSERQDHPTSATRLSDYDQTHILTVVAGYELRRWQFGLRLRYATGFPRTPVTGAYFDARDNRFDPLFGDVGSIRIPDFVQLDLHLERAFVWTRATLRIYLDLQNVTYQQNPEEIVYRADYSQRGYLTGLPTLAVLGAKVQF
ncbi:MAG: TonB family protein / TonB-dependent receptor [Myxococcales bacterium]|nr:TonB family protein / TonB-dependent receptor [Myxococcales bacterium]